MFVYSLKKIDKCLVIFLKKVKFQFSNFTNLMIFSIFVVNRKMNYYLLS